MISLDKIKKAKDILENVVHKTPLAYAPILSEKFGANIYLKKENLQLTGSFKIRGAFNKISNLTDVEKKAGIVAASAGNHAQGVAYSAKYYNIDATIVMPEATPLTKVMGVKSYGADVILSGKSYDEAYEYAIKFAKENNKSFIHPFADDEVIAGQGTIALEVLEKLDNIDMFIVPVGGGGLISGIASAVKQINPKIKVIGVVASGANAMRNSFKAKKAIDSISVKTIADGIAVRDVTPKMLDLAIELVDDIIEVEDKEIASAILFLLENQKLVVEGAGAVGLGAIMHNKIDIKNKTVVLPLSGGNIDVTMLSLIIEKGLIKSHRKLNLIVTLVDKPGSLMGLTKIFQETNANIVQIDYDRNSVKLDFGEANVTIALETKGLEHQELIKQKLKEEKYQFKEIL